MGLHLGLNATHKHPVVQYPQLARDCALPLSHGGNDNAQDSAQGHRSLQPGRLAPASAYLNLI